MDFETIRKIAKELRVKIGDILALTPRYDPFNVGTKTDEKKAKWAEEVFEWVKENWREKREALLRLGITVGRKPHLRVIHYLLMTGHPNPRRYDGKPYLGTHRDWETLLECFVKARLRGYIHFGEIVDRKHPPIIVNLLRREDVNCILPESPIVAKEITEDDVIVFIPQFRDEYSLQIHKAYGEILEFEKSIAKRIPVHIEIWSEKGRDIINEVARKYYVNVQNAVGEQTYEPVYSALKRAKEMSFGRPVVIFYVSDYDPRGELTMPIAVARKMEWMIRNLDEFKGMNVKLKKIMLTRDQVIRYELPPAPVKETEPMKERWRKLKGEYVVEVDAIESLRPIEMVKILESEITRYVKPEIIKEIEEFNYKVRRAIDEYNAYVEDQVRKAYKELDEEVKKKAEPIFRGFKAKVRIDVSDKLKEVQELIDSWKEPEWEIDLNDDWLFDSTRNYMEQIEYYKKIRG